MNIKIFTAEELDQFSIADLMAMSREIDSYVTLMNQIRRFKTNIERGDLQERFEKSMEIIRAWQGEEE